MSTYDSTHDPESCGWCALAYNEAVAQAAHAETTAARFSLHDQNDKTHTVTWAASAVDLAEYIAEQHPVVARLRSHLGRFLAQAYVTSMNKAKEPRLLVRTSSAAGYKILVCGPVDDQSTWEKAEAIADTLDAARAFAKTEAAAIG